MSGESDEQWRLEAAARFRPLAGEPSPFGEYPSGRTHGLHGPRGEYPLDGFACERDLADRVLERLDPWFVIDREVRGRHCSGRELRVDAMLRPRDRHRWRDPDVAIAVEFKFPGRARTGLNHFTAWVAQAVDYTHVDWYGFGRRVVVMCPGAATWLDGMAGDRDNEGNLLIARRLIGQLGIGELVLRAGSGLALRFQDANVWSERHGLSNGMHWQLAVRLGSR